MLSAKSGAIQKQIVGERLRGCQKSYIGKLQLTPKTKIKLTASAHQNPPSRKGSRRKHHLQEQTHLSIIQAFLEIITSTSDPELNQTAKLITSKRNRPISPLISLQPNSIDGLCKSHTKKLVPGISAATDPNSILQLIYQRKNRPLNMQP